MRPGPGSASIPPDTGGGLAIGGGGGDNPAGMAAPAPPPPDAAPDAGPGPAAGVAAAKPARPPNRWRRWRKHWFLAALCVVIPLGLVAGYDAGGADGATFAPARWGEPGEWLDARYLTAAVLFLMAFSLNSGKLVAALAKPGPVLWAAFCNVVVVPLFAYPLSFLQNPVDFRLGLMIASASACTMAGASVWTRQAGGNDAVSLLVTLATNGLCFLTAPAVLVVTTGRSVSFDVWDLMVRLLLTAALPMAVGQAVRAVPAVGRLAAGRRAVWSNLALGLVLGIVFTGAAKAGGTLGEMDLGGGGGWTLAGQAATVWGSVLLAHAGAMVVAYRGAEVLKFGREERIACAFAGSQKTLPIGLLIAVSPAMFGDPNLLGPGRGVPLAVFPMLMYHAGQLFLDTVVASKLRAGARSEPGGSPPRIGAGHAPPPGG